MVDIEVDDGRRWYNSVMGGNLVGVGYEVDDLMSNVYFCLKTMPLSKARNESN